MERRRAEAVEEFEIDKRYGERATEVNVDDIIWRNCFFSEVFQDE